MVRGTAASALLQRLCDLSAAPARTSCPPPPTTGGPLPLPGLAETACWLPGVIVGALQAFQTERVSSSGCAW